MSRRARGLVSTLPPIVVVAAMALTLTGCGGSGQATGDTSKISPSPSNSTSAVPGSAPLTKATATTLVNRAVLGNEDLGPKWSGRLIPDGATLDDPTLDLCDKTFDSDKDRLARNQTLLFSTTAALSNEVVGYKPGGAKKALEEVAAVVKDCKDSAAAEDGHSFKITAEVVPGHSSWGAGALAVRQTIVDLTDPSGSGSFLAIYQAQGDVLTIVYESEGNVSQELLFQVADLAATRLTQAFANSPRSTASIPVPTGTPLAPPGDGGNGTDRAPDPGRLA